MGYDLPSFDNEFETGGRRFTPPFHGGLSRQLVERALQLNDWKRLVILLLRYGKSAAPYLHSHAEHRARLIQGLFV
jgi:hypothetical protein